MTHHPSTLATAVREGTATAVLKGTATAVLKGTATAVREGLSPADFRDALSRFATSVTVVTAGPAGAPAGCTATSVFSISADPPSIGVSLTTGSRTLNAVVEAGTFAVNVLAWHQWQLCTRFAAGAPQHRFDGVPVEYDHGAPMLVRVASSVVCRVLSTSRLFDHTLVVGEVVHADAGAGERPLIAYQRQPHRLLRGMP